ncbi:hypothetical protein PsAD13_05137 [Pseudovibrio sp. Ad13]|nr:hypothetical protein PsAD13_05137 [Pseudovibrio sp. Ad13]
MRNEDTNNKDRELGAAPQCFEQPCLLGNL